MIMYETNFSIYMEYYLFSSPETSIGDSLQRSKMPTCITSLRLASHYSFHL